MTEETRMYGDYLIIARNSDGEILKMQNLDGTGSFKIKNIQRNAMGGVDEIQVKPQRFCVKKGEEIIGEFEKDVPSIDLPNADQEPDDA